MSLTSPGNAVTSVSVTGTLSYTALTILAGKHFVDNT
jgi:hypothetical protein